jgi:imidazoleglycerol-phosphate dehydratase
MSNVTSASSAASISAAATAVPAAASVPVVPARKAIIRRETAETKVELALNLDGTGVASVQTGVPFFDHMLTLFARHSLTDLDVLATGDVDVDYHHTVEDVGIVLGQALKQALGDKRGIRRYGFFLLPMDESLARVALDLGNRAFLAYDVPVGNFMVRDFNIILVREFFQALANNLGANIHIKLEYGDEPHHIAEAIFKAFARALLEAASVDPRQAGSLPSTKGLL